MLKNLKKMRAYLVRPPTENIKKKYQMCESPPSLKTRVGGLWVLSKPSVSHYERGRGLVGLGGVGGL
jgi:hypothetical protein